MNPNNPEIIKLKKIIEENQITNFPENGEEIVVLRENTLPTSYSIQVGIGKCWKYTNYYDCVGYVYSEIENRFTNGNIRVEKKLPRNTKVLCTVLKPGLYEKIDKAAIGFSDEKWTGSLNDFINYLENWIKIK